MSLHTADDLFYIFIRCAPSHVACRFIWPTKKRAELLCTCMHLGGRDDTVCWMPIVTCRFSSLSCVCTTIFYCSPPMSPHFSVSVRLFSRHTRRCYLAAFGNNARKILQFLPRTTKNEEEEKKKKTNRKLTATGEHWKCLRLHSCEMYIVQCTQRKHILICCRMCISSTSIICSCRLLLALSALSFIVSFARICLTATGLDLDVSFRFVKLQTSYACFFSLLSFSLTKKRRRKTRY